MAKDIEDKLVTNCDPFAAAIGLLYDINLSRRVGKVFNPQIARSAAFNETLYDALYYLSDHATISDIVKPLIGDFVKNYASRIPDHLRGFKSPKTISGHDLGGLNEGYIQLPGDNDDTGRHDHFLVNAAISIRASGLVLTELAEAYQRISGAEKSKTDVRVNGLGRQFTDGGKAGKFANGREVAKWVTKMLCDRSKCGDRKLTVEFYFPFDSLENALPAPGSSAVPRQ